MALCRSGLLAFAAAVGFALVAPAVADAGAEGECAADGGPGCTHQTAKEDKTLKKALQLEQDGRVKQSDPTKQAEAEKLFTSALKMVDKSKSALAATSDIAPSAHLFLGHIFHNRNIFKECADHFEAAFENPKMLTSEMLMERPWPYADYQVPGFHRGSLSNAVKCFHASGQEEKARGLLRRAHAAGVVRGEYQFSGIVSPAEWNLRASPWWEVSEGSNGAEQLSKSLNKNAKVLKKEAVGFLIDGVAPPGVFGVPLNEELSVNGTKTWLELILWKGGQEEPKTCSPVPKLCKLLRKYKKHLHPGGQVKLSIMRGGTTATPHCGPCDTKLRMHYTVVLPEHKQGDITVAGITKHWEEGKALMFDDSFEHTVLFDADEDATRIVLIVDLVHPDVPAAERKNLPCGR